MSEKSSAATGPQFRLVPDPEHVGPREDWICGCAALGVGGVLRGWMQNSCSLCHTAAPWMTWERVDADA